MALLAPSQSFFIGTTLDTSKEDTRASCRRCAADVGSHLGNECVYSYSWMNYELPRGYADISNL